MRKTFNLFWILFFMIGAIIPLLRMNMSEVTEQENRALAKFPEIRKAGKLNKDYGKEFETWLGDRFWMRDLLIDARFQALYKINGRADNEKAFIGQDGWMFAKNKTVNRPPIKSQRYKIEKNAELLKRFADKFKDKNISIYLVVVPEREVLYQKYWEKYYKPKPRLDYGSEWVKLLKDTPITVIDPTKELTDAMEKEDVFYKDDSHFTRFGQYIFLKKVYTSLKEQELQDIEIEPVLKNKKEKEKHVANLAAELGFPGKVEIEINTYDMVFEGLKYQELENRNYTRVDSRIYGSGEGILYRKGEAKNALIHKPFVSMGPCYSEFIFKLLRPLFSSSTWIRTNMGEGYGLNAKQDSIKEIQKLFDIKSEKGLIIITQDDFQYIKEALQ